MKSIKDILSYTDDGIKGPRGRGVDQLNYLKSSSPGTICHLHLHAQLSWECCFKYGKRNWSHTTMEVASQWNIFYSSSCHEGLGYDWILSAVIFQISWMNPAHLWNNRCHSIIIWYLRIRHLTLQNSRNVRQKWRVWICPRVLKMSAHSAPILQQRSDIFA
jgi:hypothetical protein